MVKSMLQSVMMCLVLSLVSTTIIQGQTQTNPETQSKELGKVAWYRNYEAALKLSKEQNKPVLILFQEVPGCATCRNYGQRILSHGLMVEVIENEFIPLAIFNNKGGADRTILKKYNEPTWNNPVVRIVDDKGKNLVSRVAGNYTLKGIYNAMEAALKREKKAIPTSMQLLKEAIN